MKRDREKRERELKENTKDLVGKFVLIKPHV
jgi:hypothetical protein